MTIANRDQAEHWNNGDEVGHWITHQARYDAMLAPFTNIIFDSAGLTPGQHVLDIGCGCGATTLAAARAVDPGQAIGVDLSGPMLDRARADADRAGLTNARFEQADVQVHPFDDASFDAVISRFGIMFFADPVAAFANLHRATRPGGRMAFVCWQPLTANEWLLVPGAALAQHVPLPDLGPPGAPGMFAFADPDQPRQILTAAAWQEARVTSRHASILVGGGGSLDDTVDFLRTGSMGRTMLDSADPGTAALAVDAVRKALAEHISDQGVQLDAAVWLVEASA